MQLGNITVHVGSSQFNISYYLMSMTILFFYYTTSYIPNSTPITVINVVPFLFNYLARAWCFKFLIILYYLNHYRRFPIFDY